MRAKRSSADAMTRSSESVGDQHPVETVNLLSDRNDVHMWGIGLWRGVDVGAMANCVLLGPSLPVLR